MNREELERLILSEQLSYEEIGRRCGVTGAAIKRRAKRCGIDLPRRRKVSAAEMEYLKRDKKTRLVCPICGNLFIKKRKGQKFCSSICSGAYRGNNTKGHKKAKPIWDGVEKKNMWKIGKIVKNHEYLYARCPEHPFATSTGYVYLHRLIMENYLGRILRKDEVIHHKDLNGYNNKIENLLILSHSEHSRLHMQIDKEKGKNKLVCNNLAKGKQTNNGQFEEKDIREIRFLVKEGLSHKIVADMYKVSKGAITQIVNKKTYAWVV